MSLPPAKGPYRRAGEVLADDSPLPDSPAARLEPHASGLRHLRWAREILGALEVHYEHNALLDPEVRALVLAETMELRAAVAHLSQAVKVYRDFLERERTRFRGMLRAGAYLMATAHTPDERAEAEEIAQGFDEAFEAMEVKERAPRKAAVRAAVAGLHATLAEVDEALSVVLPRAFVASLYPPLVPTRTHVADQPDEDDDATRPHTG